MTPQAAEHRYLIAKFEDGTIAQLADLYLRTSRVRQRAIAQAAGEDDEQRHDEPDLGDLSNPWVALADDAKARAYELAALMETIKVIESLRDDLAEIRAEMTRTEDRAVRRDWRLFGGYVLLLLAACAARFLPVAGWSGP